MKWSIGLMSGTSMDGIDIAGIQTDGTRIFNVLPGFTQPYPLKVRQELKSILGQKEYTPFIRTVEHEITVLHAHVIEQFLHFHHLSRQDIEVIGFHGHTVFHQSKRHEGKAFTWQIGDGQLLADMTHIPVMGDLRQNDVTHGGEGAPLVPLYHQALAHTLEKPVAIVNIGGVANVTWLGQHEDILAFDMGPGNALLDDWIYEKTGKTFDAEGTIAASGVVHGEVVQNFLQHPYFKILPPKSLDRDSFKKDWVGHLSVADGAATLTAMTVQGIVTGATYFPVFPKKWIITGGGRLNKTLLQMLSHQLNTIVKDVTVIPVESVQWNGDHLEAEAFAFLGNRALQGLPLSLPSTTGVSNSVSGGIQFYPKKHV